MTDRPFALPARRTRLIGRDAELTTVRDQILHGESRLLTLVGTGVSGRQRWESRLPGWSMA